MLSRSANCRNWFQVTSRLSQSVIAHPRYLHRSPIQDAKKAVIFDMGGVILPSPFSAAQSKNQRKEISLQKYTLFRVGGREWVRCRVHVRRHQA